MAISSGSSIIIVAWIAETFLQLVLLPIIIVGQNRQAAAADKRAEQTYRDAEAILHECQQLQAHLETQDERLGAILAHGAAGYGWSMLVLFGLSALNTETLDARMRRSRAPEYHAAFSILRSQCVAVAAAGVSGGPRSPMLPLIVVPTAFAATRFPAREVWLAMVSGICLLLTVTFGLHPAATAGHPAALLVSLALLLGVSAAVHALNGAEVQYRKTAILDPLTGLLNRQGLERRFEELAEQARMTGAPISILVCDLDHFKAVKDSLGHAAGDTALRDLAYQLRKQLRSFELMPGRTSKRFSRRQIKPCTQPRPRAGTQWAAAGRRRPASTSSERPPSVPTVGSGYSRCTLMAFGPFGPASSS